MSRPQRIGVFGGTFDPVHNTHLAIARAARDKAGLDRVWLVVSARPPHKSKGPVASPEDRYAMVEAAVADEPGIEPSRLELDREGPSYTMDTLAEVARMHKDAELYLILGHDALADFPQWRDPEGILARARLLVVPRPGGADTPEGIREHVDLLPFECNELSSTEVRERIMAGRSIDELVPAAAAKLIRERGIYNASTRDSARD